MCFSKFFTFQSYSQLNLKWPDIIISLNMYNELAIVIVRIAVITPLFPRGPRDDPTGAPARVLSLCCGNVPSHMETSVMYAV